MRSLLLIFLVAVLFTSIQAGRLRGLAKVVVSNTAVSSCTTINGSTECKSDSLSGNGSVGVSQHVHYP